MARQGGVKYHSKGIGKNKKIREERKKPLPLELMGPFDKYANPSTWAENRKGNK